MSSSHLGRMVVVANPTARSGKGENAALFAMRFFSSYRAASISCEVCLTEHAGDARRMAARASGYDTIVALGGDGVIHEVVGGLMELDVASRPRLGIIPMGSGNDFARTLTMTRNDPERSIAELLAGTERLIDVGLVNGIPFVQTLSFGLDAAIALDTTRRRAENSRTTGSALFATSGLAVLASGFKGWQYEAVIDGTEVSGTDLAFAIQNGPTYGGGFRICPDAVPNDGLLDICYTTTKASRARALALFGLIRLGRHTHSRKLHLRQFKHLEVAFTGAEQPPCQVDGEELEAERYVVDIAPSALRVITPASCPW